MSFVELASSLGLGLLMLFFAEALFGVVGYFVIAAVSFGSVRGASSTEVNLQFPWHGLARSSNGKWVVEAQAAALVGAVFVIGALAMYIAWRVGAFATN